MNINIIEPRLVINSFNDENTQKYIDALDAIILNYTPEQVIFVEIDSFGGSLYNCNRLIEKFNAIPNLVCTYCGSKAMSAGLFLLSIIGSQGLRFASPMSQMMLHELQAGAMGDMKEIENVTENCKAVNKRLLDLFALKVGLKDAKDVRKLLRDNSLGNEFFLDAKRAKELHFIDDIKYCRIIPQTHFDLLVGDPENSKLNVSYQKVKKSTKKDLV